MNPHNKTIWTDEMISFLKNNWETMTNKELAESLGLRLTTTRTKLYELGLKRMDLEYWTDEQIEILKGLYRIWGDVEITDFFRKIFPKHKGWTKKHIEKKRRYLGLKRTPQELKAINERNTRLGCFSKNHWKRWINIETKPGTVKVWQQNGYNVLVIKLAKHQIKRFADHLVSSTYVKLAHYNWINTYGEIPEGFMLVHKDKDQLNCNIENLECITLQKRGERNFVKDDKWYAALLANGDKTLRNRLCKEKEIIAMYKTKIMLSRRIKDVIRKQAS